MSTAKKLGCLLALAGVFALLSFVLWLVGHTSLSDGAREIFARNHSCPAERVRVTSRKDVRYGELVLARQSPAEDPPPAEVAADPGRLERWRADRRSAREAVLDQYEDHRLFEVRGCGHDAVMACVQPTIEDSEGTHLRPGVVECETLAQPLPAPPAR